MKCEICGRADDWIEKRVITNIDVKKDENCLICKCGNRQNAIYFEHDKMKSKKGWGRSYGYSDNKDKAKSEVKNGK